MSSANPIKALRTSARAQRTFSVGIRLVIAFILIVFSIFPILWMISASLNPTGSLATQTLIPRNAGFGNYQELFNSNEFPFWRWLGNSPIRARLQWFEIGFGHRHPGPEYRAPRKLTRRRTWARVSAKP